MATLERLLNLTAALLATGVPLTAEEIRERIPDYPEGDAAFHRAFERDKAALRGMGIPLSIEPVPGRMPAVDGYRISKDRYELRDPGFEPEELAALHLAASAVRFDTSEAESGLLKLGGLVRTSDAPRVEVGPLPNHPALPVLFEGVTRRAPVRFVYRDTERVVDPYRLDLARGRWYLTGYDHTREAERLYRVDRIAGTATVVDGPTFDPPQTEVPGRRLNGWELGEGEPELARVRIDPEQAAWAVQTLGSDAVVDAPADGSVVVELAVTNREAFRSFVLGFLEHAEVLEPAALRDDVVQWLEGLAS